MELFLNNRIYNSKTLSGNAIATYCALKMSYPQKDMEEICFSLHQLEYNLLGYIGTPKVPIRFSSAIKSGLKELIDQSFIEFISEYNNSFIVNCQNLSIHENDKFVSISSEDIKKIVSLKNKNKFSILKYYICLVSTFSHSIYIKTNDGNKKNNIIGNVTTKYLSSITGMSTLSIIKYNSVLENNNLIYIYRHKGYFINDRNEISSPVNIYGRYSDAEYVKAYANQQSKDIKIISAENVPNTDIINNKRRLTQIYNQIVKGNGEKYTRDEILEVYRHISSENEKYSKLKEDHPARDISHSIRDMSIFDQFDFIKGE